MPTKRPIKKVDIGDDSVVDLKAKERSSTADLANFTIHRINSEVEQTPDAPAFQPERPISRTPRFDPDELQQRMENFAEKLEKAVIKVSPAESTLAANSVPDSTEPKDYIKVKFDKFVQLVASRDFLSVLEQNRDEEIVMSSNLLTELAGAVEEKSEKKTPVIFLVGLAIGVVITYLLINR